MRINNKWLKDGAIFKQLTIACFISIFLVSCGNDKDAENSKKESSSNKVIQLSADGVGTINANSAFNMHEVTMSFPDYSVVEELNYHLGAPYPVIRVSKGIKTLLIINPDTKQEKIFSVIIEDNLIKNTLGHRLGTAYNKVYAYGQTEECQLGTEDMAAKVLCYAPKTPNIIYVFNGKGGNGNSVPPADVLQGWSLESIIWRPKS